MVYLTQLGGSALYQGPVDRLVEIDSILEQIQTYLEPALNTWLGTIFGTVPTDQKLLKHVMGDVRKLLMEYEKKVKSGGFLCGSDLSLADVSLACSLVYPFRAVFEPNFLKPLAKLKEWFERVLAIPEIRQTLGAPKFCQKAVSAFVKKDKPKPAPKGKQAPKKQETKKQEPKKEEVKQVPAPPKSVNPLDELPPSRLVVFDWKTQFVNSPDKRAELEKFWTDLYDPEGWSVYLLHYEKAEGEGEKVFMTSNLVDGFMQRLDFMRKYSFGSMGVYGDEPSLEVKGVFLWRGVGIPQIMNEHPSFEYYRTQQLDPSLPEHRQIIADYWTKAEESDQVEGLAVRYFKLWV